MCSQWGRSAMAALAMSAIFAWSPSAYAQTAGEAASNAKAAFAAEDYAEALKWLKKAYEIEPAPVLVYNMGRALEGLGRIAEAHGTYLRVSALPGVDENLSKLASAKAKDLEALKNLALVRIRGVPDEALVQVDGDVVDTGKELRLDAGDRQVCVVTDGGKSVLCRTANAKAGVRTSWDVSSPPAQAGTITWDRREGVTALRLNGHALVVDVGALSEIKVVIGEHTISLVGSGGSDDVRLVVTPGSQQPLPDPVRRPDPAVVAGAAAPVDSGPGAMPWVLGGAGVVAAGAGGFFMAQASSDKSAVTSPEVGSDGLVRDTTRAEAEEAWDSARSKERTGAILVGVGGAAVIGAVVWLLASGSGDDTGGDADAEPDTVSLGVAPSLNGGLVLGGRF